MEVDIVMVILSSVVFFVYFIICIISIIFTFSIDKYRKIDEMLNLDIISRRVLTPLEVNINIIDDWLIEHHRLIGPLLIYLSLLDLKLSFNIINLFSLFSRP